MVKLKLGLDFLLDQLFPWQCFVCGQSNAGNAVCADCQKSMPIMPPACPRCAQANKSAELCGQCQMHPPYFDSARACFQYVFPVVQMIHALKYRQQLSLMHYFSQQIASWTVPPEVNAILPVPMPVSRLRQRGYNQAMGLAQLIARQKNIKILHGAVERVANVLPQETLSRSQRIANVHRSFVCKQTLKGAHILLIDDVMTTGATVNELARILKLHHAAKVHVWVVARTQVD